MRHDVMLCMDADELDRYARLCGIDTSGADTKAEKIEVIEGRRERVADIRIIGLTFHVPVKRYRDDRYFALIKRYEAEHTDEVASLIMQLLLGEEQFDAMVAHCTDEDGTVDVVALAHVFRSLIAEGRELKNF